jgi:serine phosphatase RsbU (regulator of sigma subunit)
MNNNDPVYLLRNTPDLLYRGRLFLAIAETFVVTVLLIYRWERDAFAYTALASLCIYNFVIIWLLRNHSIRHIRVWLVLLGDLLFVTIACIATGNSASPFIGHFYLLTFASSMFYGMAGGVLMGFLMGMITAGLGLRTQEVQGRYPVMDILHTAPYFPLIGAFSGFLVREVQRWFGRFNEQQAQVEIHEENEENYHNEMQLARLVQESVVPSAPPIHAGFAFATRSHPSQEVGGDFHLFLEETNCFGAILGDVSGKGVAAALIATSLSTVLPYLHPLRDPLSAFEHLNSDLYKRSPEASFVTLICARFPAHSNTIHVFNAGHYPPLLWQGTSQSLFPTPLTPCPPLGLMPHCPKATNTCHEQSLPFTHGDTLLLYSDALVETRNAAGEMFGEARLAEVFRTHATKDVETIADALVAAVITHGALKDDLTLLLCQKCQKA